MALMSPRCYVSRLWHNLMKGKAMNLNEIVRNVSLTKTCSIKPDKDSAESKAINVKVVFDGVPLKAVFDKAVSQAIIQWQNGPGRAKFDLWNNHQVVEIQFKAPAANVKTREEQIAETKAMFMKAGLPEAQAIELATKAVDNPEVLS